ncbi:Auxin efflux carrier family protein [Perilla frutescens var. hirtella]|uniref:Auxin efflux carrier family protein n=1 Tax=Perilla frutescens var. hirtella TaxID=608512 RepID=A0AAD4IW97_PERFH|nr:Auxin efflux carrier family protein [Perilla frutescens var. hirtella]
MIYGEKDSLSAIVPLLKLLCLTLIGLFLGHRKTQIVPKATFKLLSKLVFALFLPCLTFIHLGQSITLENIKQWWFIPVNVLVSTAVGLVLGVLVVIICRPPPQYTRFTIIMTAFGNTGNLPLAIVGSVCHDDENLFGPDCKKKGVAYVSFAQWMAVILVYTVVYHMMEPPLEYFEIVERVEKEEQQNSVELSKSLLVEAEWPGIEDKETENCKTPFIATIDIPGDDRAGDENESSQEAIGCLVAPGVVRKMKIVAEQTPIPHILQPPTIASLLAIIVGMVPQIKSFVFGYDAPLSLISDSLEILAGAMVPSVMLILGGMLAEGPDDSKLGRRTTIGIILARLLVLPLVGIGIVVCSDKLHFLVKDDQMYKFVLLLQYTTPSAILLGAIASLRGYAVSESSALLFWQHLLALFSLSLYVVIYFNLVL